MSKAKIPGPVAVDPSWVWNHAEIWGRAVELTHARYVEAMAARPAAAVDSYVELLLWAVAMRMLWRVADAARKLELAAVSKATRAFRLEVNVTDMRLFRDITQHADAYATGAGHQQIRALTVDIDRWTAAAQVLRQALRQAVRPTRPV